MRCHLREGGRFITLKERRENALPPQGRGPFHHQSALAPARRSASCCEPRSLMSEGSAPAAAIDVWLSERPVTSNGTQAQSAKTTRTGVVGKNGSTWWRLWGRLRFSSCSYHPLPSHLRHPIPPHPSHLIHPIPSHPILFHPISSIPSHPIPSHHIPSRSILPHPRPGQVRPSHPRSSQARSSQVRPVQAWSSQPIPPHPKDGAA